MGIIEYHEGCNVRPEGCFGPKNNFYTIFGTELVHLKLHILFSIVLGMLLFGVLLFLKKKEKIKLPIYLLIIIPILFAVLLFFILAFLFPVKVIY